MLDDETFNNQYNSMKKNINHMSETIENFRDFYKKDKKKKVFNLEKLFNRIYELVSIEYERKNISLEMEVDKSLTLNSYESELTQVILSLISNAKDALNGISKEEKFIKISACLENNLLVIKVEDNANGISNNIKDKIFEPYFTTKSELNGTGLGLYMSKMLVEKSLEGEIYFETKNNGTIFNIKLPIKGATNE